MPAPPTPRNYDPEQLGAKCADCPLDCKGRLSVPPRKATAEPKAILILESPDAQSKYLGHALAGPTGQRFSELLDKSGLSPDSCHFVFRMACCPRPQHRIDKFLRQAAKACLQRTVNEIKTLDPANKLPRLYLGKWSPIGLMQPRQYNAGLEIKLSQGIVRHHCMALTHPRIPIWHNPAGLAPFQASLRRFAAYAQGKPWPQWPGPDKLITAPTEAALIALRNMGPTVAADVETLGVDPMTAPITAIGISDGQHTVSLNWATYENQHGHYSGIANRNGPLAEALRAELKSVLLTRQVIGQNLSYDLLAFEQLGWNVQNGGDTLDAHKIIWPEIPASLEAIGVHLLDLPSRWKTEFRAGRDNDEKGSSEFADSPLESLLCYNAKDALVTALAWHKLQTILLEDD